MNRSEAGKHNVIFGVYPWAFDCPGGGERQLMAWKFHLESQGHNIRLYDPWKPVPEESKIFHFFSVMPGSFQLCEYFKNKGYALVITPNLWVTPETKWNYPHDDIQRLISITDRVVVNSLLEAQALSEVYNIDITRFRVVYNGVEQSFFQPAHPELFRAYSGLENKRYLLNVANVESRKNQLLFLEALKNYPDLTLVVIGHARDAEYLEECKRVGKEQFHYIGPLEYGSELLRSAMAGSEAFVMPSTLETPSIAALEAAASGCRILVTKVGSTTEYFGEKAIYIEPDSIQSMSDGIRQIFMMPVGCLRERIHDEFTWGNVICDLEKVYTELLSECGE
ncbi:glycosyltransferase family 4 protein [Rahnella sikkimica]|uniref:Glycosyltransferase n=1 Tax=Rahnella sikkimica TaxID=1805933 RepID=A0A2L1UVX0_9GAMM|nr:glycosyltransferase family 4 protein [Rahnella sikkimica]AVF37024.1 glycosyltransferase [Rahnella sikkimica]